jgi:ABC-type branched-subunit amino acid transport system substrate-binding protein
MHKLSLLLVSALLLLVTAQPLAQEELPEVVTANRTECEVDLTGQTFDFWHLGDLSGPYGPITQPVLAGFEDATAYFNERGGICGAEIVLPDATTIDTGGDQNQSQIIYDRIAAEDPLLIVLYGSADSELLRDQLITDQIPSLISAGSVEGLYGENADEPGWVFATNPLYVDQMGQFCDYAAENIDSPVIGYISWPGAFGEAAYTPETIAYCESIGVEVLDTPELFAPGSDISGAVQNLVDAGANILYTNSLATGPANVAATVTNLGLNDQVQIAGVNWALDTSVGLLGLSTFTPEGLPSTNGIIGSMPFTWWTETDNAGIQVVTEVANANERPATTRNIAYILGFLTIDSYIETLIQTANRTGGGDFTGADVYETLQALDYNAMDIMVMNFTNEAGDAIRDTESNRMAMLTYAGVDGGTIMDGQAPLLVDVGGNMIPVPVVVPLEDFRPSPDLRPGGVDVPMSDE